MRSVRNFEQECEPSVISATRETGPGIHTDVLVLPGVLASLRESPSPAQVAGQQYLLRFREACKAIRQELEAAGRDERQAFEAAFERIEEYLAEMPVPRHPGLAVFAGAERGSLYAVPLPERPATVVVWDAQPLLTPLKEVLDEHERIGVVLAEPTFAHVR